MKTKNRNNENTGCQEVDQVIKSDAELPGDIETVASLPEPPPPPPPPAQEPPKRKRGRPRKEEQKKVDIDFTLPEGFTKPIWDTIFGIVASRRGQHWRLTPEELDNLDRATIAAVNYYIPDLTKHMPLIVFAGTLTSIVFARLDYEKRQQPAKAQ